MRIASIHIENFRIYRGTNEIDFPVNKDKNISLIAGKNGFGKTTFLTSLIWCLYGKQMSQVEEKYKSDIRTSGGYEKFLESLLNKDVKKGFEDGESNNAHFGVKVKFHDILIPSVPCNELVISRKYDFVTKKEELQILIDGDENELTKEVGYEVFINDFILPREIAKFFFFDAEKVVSLAEAKSASELKALSKAYAEVLGIKKYEDLKESIKIILSKLRRSNASEGDKLKIEENSKKAYEIEKLIELKREKLQLVVDEISSLKLRIDHLQEKLIREGNEMTLEELKALKNQRDQLKKQNDEVKAELKKLMDLVPLAIALPRVKELVEQLKLEQKLKAKDKNIVQVNNELKSFASDLDREISSGMLKAKDYNFISEAMNRLLNQRLSEVVPVEGTILLDYDDETVRFIIATYEYIQGPFKEQLNLIVQRDKDIKFQLRKVAAAIKQGEARKDNTVAKQLRLDKAELTSRLEKISEEKGVLQDELDRLSTQKASVYKVLSELEKNFEVAETDRRKYEVADELLEKLKLLTAKIKLEKKYALERSILTGLNRLMHKDKLIAKVNVRIEEDVMDIDLLDANNRIIDKDNLSKGEQQLYATALLKALVDQSGIDFPVFIDSPLQKFDKQHASNVIQQFYPRISDQVVLFPLLEKELNLNEYELLKPNLNSVYLIENNQIGSSVNQYSIGQLFNQFNKQHVDAH